MEFGCEGEGGDVEGYRLLARWKWVRDAGKGKGKGAMGLDAG